MNKLSILENWVLKLGSSKSGNYGHKGRPGEIGGSAAKRGGFGVWSEDRIGSLVSDMQKKYPEFYRRLEEHVGEEAAIMDIYKDGSGLKESEVPSEIIDLVQWDLNGRLGGADHIKLYSGRYDHSIRPGRPQPDPKELQDRYDRDGFPKMMSFTSSPQKAYDFSEGSGSVVVATIPISDIKISHYVAPVMGATFGGEEFEFIVSPSKSTRFNVSSSDRFLNVVKDYKSKGYRQSALIAYKGARFSGAINK